MLCKIFLITRQSRIIISLLATWWRDTLSLIYCTFFSSIYLIIQTCALAIVRLYLLCIGTLIWKKRNKFGEAFVGLLENDG